MQDKTVITRIDPPPEAARILQSVEVLQQARAELTKADTPLPQCELETVIKSIRSDMHINTVARRINALRGMHCTHSDALEREAMQAELAQLRLYVLQLESKLAIQRVCGLPDATP